MQSAHYAHTRSTITRMKACSTPMHTNPHKSQHHHLLIIRFWSDPNPTATDGWAAADHRMQLHRQRLVARGFAPAGLQPQWCSQHAGTCTLPPDASADHSSTTYRSGGTPHAQMVQPADALYESDAAGAQRR